MSAINRIPADITNTERREVMMIKKIGWLLLVCLVAAGLILVSCGPAEEEEEEVVVEEEEEVVEEEEEEVVEEEEVSSDTPKYGGVLRIIEDNKPRTLDDCYIVSHSNIHLTLTHEEMMEGDWLAGPAGRYEIGWLIASGFSGQERFASEGHGLATSWDLDVANLTITWHIREGVHFHNKPPVNGREMTADDVAFSLNRQWDTPGTFYLGAYPRPKSITATDRYTVVTTFNSFYDMSNDFAELGDAMYIWPEEWVKANDNDMRAGPQVNIGTGPYMFTDYVDGSSMTYVRNPDYWDTDPTEAGKGNQLPYLDGVKTLIILDPSTRLAAMRTAKGDQQDNISWEDAAVLKQSNPELLFAKLVHSVYACIAMRLDNPEFPWVNKGVRQALQKALDMEAINEGFFGGEGVFPPWPSPALEFKDVHLDLEDLPESTQFVFEYDVEKAKQMMADAGYADGFDMHMVCEITDVDLLSIVKDYWEKINVNLILEPKEYSVFRSILNGRTHEQAIDKAYNSSRTFVLDEVRDVETCSRNASFVDDDFCNELHSKVWEEYFDWDERCRLLREAVPYILENCWYIQLPAYAQYTFWQPWVKGYHGEYGTGNSDPNTFTKWVWLDLNLKEEMIGQR